MMLSAFMGGLGVEPIPPAACDSLAEYSGGGAYPSQFSVQLGPNTGWVELQFWSYSRPDKFQVLIDGQVVLDTGYVGDTSWQGDLDTELTSLGDPTETIIQRKGTSSSGTDPTQAERRVFYKESTSSVATVRVWAPLGGTAWSCRLGCPNADEYLPANQVPGYWDQWDMSALSLSDNDTITGVVGEVGNSNLVEHLPANNPTFKTGGINGKSYMLMDADTELRLSTAFKKDYDYTVFAVIRGAVQDQTSFCSAFSIGYAACYFRDNGSQSVFIYDPAGFEGNNYDGGWINSVSGASLVTSRSGSSDSTSPHVNGVPLAVPATGDNRWVAMGYDAVGSSANPSFEGELYEIIVYDRVLSTSETRSVETYLSRKYGIEYAWQA